jgi:hypothetical protein
MFGMSPEGIKVQCEVCLDLMTIKGHALILVDRGQRRPTHQPPSAEGPALIFAP